MVSLSEQQVTIELPEMQIPKDLKFPTKARYCIVAFCVTLFDLNNDRYETQEIQSFEIELNHQPFTVPAQQLNFKGAPGALSVITLGLYYLEKTFAGKEVINNKDLSPSAVLKAAFCPGEIEIQETWSTMVFNEKRNERS